MIIDCTRCPARGVRCDGCVMTLAVGNWDGSDAPSQLARLTAEERRAVAVLAAAGLIERPGEWATRPPSTQLAG